MSFKAAIFLFLVPTFALACPYCAGSDGSKDKYTVLFLSIFIVGCYIPFLIIWRKMRKFKALKAEIDQ